MKNWKIAFLLVAAAAISACYPLSSKNPLGNRASGEDLVGAWLGDEEDARFEFVRKGRRSLDLKVIGLDEDKQILHYAIRPSRIGGKTYMSVMQYFPDDSIQSVADAQDISFKEARDLLRGRDKRMNGYYLAHYTITPGEEGDVLRIALMDMDSEIVRDAIEEGDLSGGPVTVRNEEGEEDDILYLTSSTRRLTSFVAQHGDDVDELFDLTLGDLTRAP